MKYAILADIHANLEALNVCLEATRGVDGYICPGDIVGYGPNPNECVEIIRGLKSKIVAGNHDRVVAGQLDINAFSREAASAAEWTRKIITGINLKYLEELPEYIEDNDFEMVHGSLRDPLEEYISSISEGIPTIELMKKKLCLVGHLHIPLVITKEPKSEYDGWQLADGDVVKTSEFDKTIINVGSVGQPRDMDSRASFGIYDTAAKTIEIRKVVYNISAVQEKMRKSDLPDFLVERLSFGR